MKHFKNSYIVLFLFFLSANSIRSQHIAGLSDPHITSDWLYLDGNLIQHDIIGTCRYGMLQVDTGDSIYTHYAGEYCFSSKIDQYDGTWVAMVNSWPADDVGGDYLMILAGGDGDSVFIVNDYFSYDSNHENFSFHYRDYSLGQNEMLYVIDGNTNELKILDFKGTLISAVPGFDEVKQIDYHNNALYTFTDQDVNLLDENYTRAKTITIPAGIDDYQWEDDILYLFSHNKIYTIDTTFSLLNIYPFYDLAFATDFKVSGGDFYFISNTNDVTTSIYKSTDRTKIELLSHEDFPHLTYTHFIHGDTNDYLVGIQEDGRRETIHEILNHNAIRSDIGSLAEETNDFSISVNDIETFIDTIEIFIFAGDTIYNQSYTYNLSYSIENESSDTLHNCGISSNKKHGVNCAYASYFEYHENLNLAPGETFHVDTLWRNAGLQFESICLTLLHANGSYDTQFDNNYSCFIVDATDDLIQTIHPLIYPNPTSSFLYIDHPVPISSIEVFDLKGKKLMSLGSISRQGINLDGLPNGVYVIKVQNLNGTVFIQKIVKN